MKAHIFTDGGSRGNPGPGASAFMALLDPENEGRVLHKRSEYIGKCTNNEAEYRALIMGLEWARSRGIIELRIHTDSLLIVRQLKGEYKVKAPTLIPLNKKVRTLLEGVDWNIQHNRRDHKWISACDELVNRTLDSV